MAASPCVFGDYLKQLIKEAAMTHVAFYTALGIKKPYFYDILSGRTNPPPPALQFRMMDILRADEETRILFFDLAACVRGEMPADIAALASENPVFIRNIRHNLKHLLTAQR